MKLGAILFTAVACILFPETLLWIAGSLILGTAVAALFGLIKLK